MAEEIKLPLPVETCDRGRIYNWTLNKWEEAWLNVYSHPQENAVINISTPGMHNIIPATPFKSINISSIFFTVSAETNITLYASLDAISGPMDFGGDGEPKGISLGCGQFPIELFINQTFYINLSDAAQVSGMVSFFYR